jgi:hypothetical protein
LSDQINFISRLVCETPALISGAYSRFWTPLLQALIGVFELPEDDSIPDDEHFIDIEDTPGYQVKPAIFKLNDVIVCWLFKTSFYLFLFLKLSVFI